MNYKSLAYGLKYFLIGVASMALFILFLGIIAHLGGPLAPLFALLLVFGGLVGLYAASAMSGWDWP